MPSSLASALHTFLATGIFLAFTALFWIATHVPVNAQEVDSDAAAASDASSGVQIPEFDELLETITDGDKWEKELAAAMLIEYPERAGEFTEPLARFFLERDESKQRVATRVFDYMHEPVMPHLAKLFNPANHKTDEENENWRKSCGIINAIGDPAREQFEPLLLEVLESYDDVDLRIPAVYALTGFSNGSVKAIPNALTDIPNENFNVSLAVCRLVIKTGREAQVAVPAMRDLMANGNLSQRTWAAWSLGAIGPTDDYDPLPDIEPLLERFALGERQRGLRAIGLLGKHAERLEPRVRQMMTENGTNLEATAAYVLWQITGNTTETVPRLIELAGTLDFEYEALEHLREMGPAAEDAVEFLLERSATPDYTVRSLAIDALSKIAPDNDKVVQRIDKALEDPHPVVRLAARLAVRNRSTTE